jgi:hypothetical protein
MSRQLSAYRGANQESSFRDDVTYPSRYSIGQRHNAQLENIKDSKVLVYRGMSITFYKENFKFQALENTHGTF